MYEDTINIMVKQVIKNIKYVVFFGNTKRKTTKLKN